MLDIDPNKQSGQGSPAPQSWNPNSVPTPQAVPKDRKKVGSKFSGATLYFGILAVFIVLMGAGIWGLIIYKDNQVNSVNSDISNIDTQIAKLRSTETEALALQAKYENVSSILDKRKIWTALIEVLGQDTLKKATFSTLAAGTESTIVELSGTTDSLTNMAKLIVAFQNSENFSGIEVTSLAMPSDNEADFNFGITLNYSSNIVSPNKNVNENQ